MVRPPLFWPERTGDVFRTAEFQWISCRFVMRHRRDFPVAAGGPEDIHLSHVVKSENKMKVVNMWSRLLSAMVYLPAAVTGFFAFHFWSEGLIMPAALLTAGTCILVLAVLIVG
ncbi:hypothetical protein KDQ92_004938 [Salmonella enterica subsp. enterica serovar Newport]|nr:hypothetical protein [Salmonella enterica subsp. enterica serovar Newport]